MKTIFLTLVGLAYARRVFVYLDDWSSPGTAAIKSNYLNLLNAGASDLINAFLVPDCSCGAADVADSAGQWASLSAGDRNEILSVAHAKGGHLIVSTGGATYTTDYLKFAPAAFADTVCGHAQSYGYDGVDFDFEHFPVGFGPDGAGVKFLQETIPQCRKYVNLITSAPQNPYLGAWGNYGFEVLYDYVDYFLVQFYNQYAEQSTYEGTFVHDSSNQAWKDLANRNPQNKHKLIVGKYVYSRYGGQGMIEAGTLAQYLDRAEKELGYTGEIMIWKHPMQADGLLDQWLSTDLPKLAAGGSSAPVVTQPPAVVTQPPAVVTQPPAVVTQPPAVVTQPGVATQPAPNVPTTKAQAANPGGSDPISSCKAQVGNPTNAVWNADCQEKCTYYGTAAGAPWCVGGSTDAATLVNCVLSMHHGQCVKI